MSSWTERLQRNVALAPRTTLQVGGPAEFFFSARSTEEMQEALRWAENKSLPVWFLGGGSNVVFADAGLPGLTLSFAGSGVDISDDGLVSAEAGVVWDALVAQSVSEGCAGLECMSGIPGLVGAAPVQNVGAYGQEVAQTLVAVTALDRQSRELHRLSAQELDLSYRSSRLKHAEAGRWIVTSVEFQLTPGGEPVLRYPELRRRVGASASLHTVRRIVREIRAEKSMLWSATDPNHRSAGSFFTNPIVNDAVAGAIDGPKYPAGEGLTKLSAAWLIENSGFTKGWGDGSAGLSSKHCLAIINRGNAQAQDILRVAAVLRRGVMKSFSVLLEPEPVFLGFAQDVDSLLDQA